MSIDLNHLPRLTQEQAQKRGLTPCEVASFSRKRPESPDTSFSVGPVYIIGVLPIPGKNILVYSKPTQLDSRFRVTNCQRVSEEEIRNYEPNQALTDILKRKLGRIS